jgi:putative phage-type endonuclease
VTVGHAVPVARTDTMDRADWLAERRRGIGGSDAAAICGQDRWTSQFEVWMDKAGVLDAPELSSEAAEWGLILEPIVREQTARRTGAQITPVPYLLAHPDRPWQLANVDGLAEHPEHGRGLAEIKTAGYWTGDAWDGDEVPDAYLLQGMHYLSVTGLPFVLYGVLIAGQRLETRVVHRDDDLIAHLVDIETEFWQLVASGTPPEPDGSQATTDFLAHLYDVKPDLVVTLDPFDVDLIIERRALAIDDINAAKERRAEAENQLKVLIGEGVEAITPDGRPLFSWRSQTKRGIDTKRLRRALYDVADELETTSDFRVLRVPAPKGL